MPLLDDIKNVLSFAAFRPDPDDAQITWRGRYSGRKSLLLNISRTHTTWRSINKRGKLQESGSQEGEFADIAQQHAESWRSMTDGGWVGVSLNNRFIISLENNLSRRDNTAELLRSNPKAVLGAKFDRGKRYAMFSHPESSESLLMACDESMVKTTEDILRVNGLKAGRVCCGLFAMLEQKLRELQGKGNEQTKDGLLLVVCCEGSIASLIQQDGQWTDMRCRSGVGAENIEAMIQIIVPMVQKLPQGTPVMFMHDGNDAKFASAMMEQLQQIGCRDVSAEDQIWQTLSQH